MSLPLRKRLDYRLLRWQARFEGSGFDRMAPWAIAAVMWILLLLLGLARSRELSEETSLAGAMQTVWLIGDGFVPKSSLLAHNYLFEQAGYLIYPSRCWPRSFQLRSRLLVVQSGALAVGVVPLWRLARKIVKLRIGSTVAIAIAYGAYSAIHAVNLAGFHLESLALPAMLAAVYNGMRGTWVRYWVFVVIVLSARADLGLAIAGLGILWWVDGRRRLGYATFAVGFGWAAAAILLIQPAYAGGDYPHVEAFAAYGGDDPFRVLWGMISSPIQFARSSSPRRISGRSSRCWRRSCSSLSGHLATSYQPCRCTACTSWPMSPKEPWKKQAKTSRSPRSYSLPWRLAWPRRGASWWRR